MKTERNLIKMLIHHPTKKDSLNTFTKITSRAKMPKLKWQKSNENRNKLVSIGLSQIVKLHPKYKRWT